MGYDSEMRGAYYRENMYPAGSYQRQYAEQ